MFDMEGSYSNFAPKEPNDNVGKENCVEMMSTHGKWNDMPCSYRLGYFCQHPLGIYIYSSVLFMNFYPG